MAYRPWGYVPIGGIIAWAKSLTGVPALNAGYVECNGQTLSDTASLLNGQVIPDLNGALGDKIQRFLRGAATSGGTGGTESHCHCYNLCCTMVASGSGAYPACCTCGVTCPTATLPSYYQVVWICRIK
jgi:hypothetical protein